MEKTQVQKEFEAISAVPRCSFHNKKAIQYVIGQAKELGLEYVYDEENGNVLIRRPAMIGKRDRAALVLQGHLDMVPQVDPGVQHDFTKDPIDLKIKGDYYFAEGTTLGADDGVAVALAMAILKDKDLKNPPIEVLFTTDEEVGMLSVKNGNFDYVRGKYLINLDHCEEGSLIVGCCGGITANFHLPVKKEKFPGVRYTISISGLTGGHSGIDIHKERANAIKLMAQYLLNLSKLTDFRIRTFQADGKDNAISNNACVELIAKAADKDLIKKYTREMQLKFRHIFRKTDPKIKIGFEEGKRFTGESLTKNCGSKLISFLVQLPYGVIKREQDDFSKPETSANIGIVETGKKTIDVVYSIRSSVSERAQMVAARVENLGKLVGAKAQISKEYPAWLPDFHSPMLAPFKAAYKELYGEYPVVETVHAGVECGYLIQKSGIEAAVAMGANITGEHTTDEKLSISSLNRTYEYLRAVIERF